MKVTILCNISVTTVAHALLRAAFIPVNAF